MLRRARRSPGAPVRATGRRRTPRRWCSSGVSGSRPGGRSLSGFRRMVRMAGLRSVLASAQLVLPRAVCLAALLP